MFVRILAAGMVLLGIGRTPFSIAQQPQFSAGEVRRAAEYSRSQKQVSLIVWQDGRILREEHRGDAPALHHIRSISKPLWALAVLAVADSRGRNIDAPASEVFGEWKSVAGKSKITVRQLLDHTSGLASGPTRTPQSPMPKSVPSNPCSPCPRNRWTGPASRCHPPPRRT